MSNKTIWLGLGLVIAVFLSGIFLLGKKDGSVENAVPAPGVTNVEEMIVNKNEAGESAEEGSEVQEIIIEGSEFKYSPSTISLKPDIPVKLTFKNKGTMPHDLVIDGFGVSTKVIIPGKEEVISFTPEVGTFSYYCSIGNHRALGMEGELRVE